MNELFSVWEFVLCAVILIGPIFGAGIAVGWFIWGRK